MLKQILLSTLAITVIACGNDTPDAIGGGNGGNAGAGGGGGNYINTSPSGFGSNGGGATSGTAKPGDLNFVIRDFKFYSASDSKTNPDFENVPSTAAPTTLGWVDLDIVTDELGSDHKPIYKNASGKTITTHGKAAFDQWFKNVDGTNITQSIPVTLTQNTDGSYVYDSKSSGPLNKDGMFFPIDDGTPYATEFGNQGGKDANGRSHNFSFTLEIHTVFTYQGGEDFFFRGDDDVFVYINNKLVINLGGIHGTQEKNVAIDSLGLTKGDTYNLDFFYTERHVVASDLLITTGLELSNNGDIPIY
jgi:fibro-slime domain-containing protein